MSEPETENKMLSAWMSPVLLLRNQAIRQWYLTINQGADGEDPQQARQLYKRTDSHRNQVVGKQESIRNQQLILCPYKHTSTH